MFSVPNWLKALSLILLAGCSSSGIFGGRGSRGQESVAQAFEAQRDAAPEEQRSRTLRRADAPVARTSATTAPKSATETRQRLQIAEALAEGGRAERSNDLKSARTAYEKVLSVDPQHSFANYQLAVIADNEGRFAEAERHYQTLLRKSPRNADLLASLGWSYLLQGRYEESERTLREALAVDSKHRTAMYNLGWLYGTLGNYDQALTVFRTAGSDEDAQRAMAELFPRGRPAATAQLSSGLPKNPFVSGTNGANAPRRRAADQIGGESLSAPAPWQRNSGTALAGGSGPATRPPTSVNRPGSNQESADFDMAFAELNGSAGNITPVNGAESPRIGSLATAAASDVPLTPPPGHDMPVITPRSGHAGMENASSTSPAADLRGSAPIVGELTAGPLRNPGRPGPTVPDWPNRTERAAGASSAGSPGMDEAARRSPRSLAARMGLAAGPGGLPFPLGAAPPVVLSQAPAAGESGGSRREFDQRTAAVPPDAPTAGRVARW
jgi:Flp pilus assembly protein TadD